MLKSLVSLTIIYSLTFLHGCRNTSTRSSLKEVPTNDGAFNELLNSVSKEDHELAKLAKDLFQEANDVDPQYFVVINSSTKEVRAATKEEAYGSELNSNERIFAGSPASRRIVDIQLKKSRLTSNAKKYNIHIIVYDLMKFREEGTLHKLDGHVFNFPNTSDEGNFQSELTGIMTKVRSIMADPLVLPKLAQQKSNEPTFEEKVKFFEGRKVEADHDIKQNTGPMLLNSTIAVITALVLIAKTADVLKGVKSLKTGVIIAVSVVFLVCAILAFHYISDRSKLIKRRQSFEEKILELGRTNQLIAD